MSTFYNYNDRYCLAHYGILGMHWGVRRFQPYPSDYQGGGKEIGQAAAAAKTRIKYNDAVKVKAGETAFRVSITGDAENNKGAIYLTVDRNDRKAYMANWAEEVKYLAKADKKANVYEQQYKVVKDLISPSVNERHDIFRKMFDDKKVKEAIKNRNGWTDDDMKRYEDADDLKKAGMVSRCLGSEPIVKTRFFNEVKKRGYNMVIDDYGADYGGSNRVNAPIIVLDDKAIKFIKSKPVRSNAAIASARLNRHVFNQRTMPGNYLKRNFVPNINKADFGLANYYNTKKPHEWPYPDRTNKGFEIPIVNPLTYEVGYIPVPLDKKRK